MAFFIRVVEKRGVAAAGRDFGMSAATASERLAGLEETYGATLLNRTTRSMSLTDEGRTLLAGARHLVSEASDLAARIAHGSKHLSGQIRVSATNDFGEARVVPLLDEFMAEHPNIRVELSLQDGYVDLVGQGIDIAFRFGQLRDSALIARKLGPNRRVVCAAPEYLAACRVPEHPQDLLQHNCLVMQFGPTIDRHWKFQIEGRDRTVSVFGNRTANSGTLVRRWCLAGHGIALKSIWDVGDDLATGRLVELLSDYRADTTSSLQLVHSRSGPLPRRVRVLIDFLVANLAQAYRRVAATQTSRP